MVATSKVQPVSPQLEFVVFMRTGMHPSQLDAAALSAVRFALACIAAAHCRALCDEYPRQCFTLVHNRYGECYLRTEHAGAGVPDEKQHRTVSCRRHASW